MGCSLDRRLFYRFVAMACGAIVCLTFNAELVAEWDTSVDRDLLDGILTKVTNADTRLSGISTNIASIESRAFEIRSELVDQGSTLDDILFALYDIEGNTDGGGGGDGAWTTSDIANHLDHLSVIRDALHSPDEESSIAWRLQQLHIEQRGGLFAGPGANNPYLQDILAESETSDASLSSIDGHVESMDEKLEAGGESVAAWTRDIHLLLQTWKEDLETPPSGTWPDDETFPDPTEELPTFTSPTRDGEYWDEDDFLPEELADPLVDFPSESFNLSEPTGGDWIFTVPIKWSLFGYGGANFSDRTIRIDFSWYNGPLRSMVHGVMIALLSVFCAHYILLELRPTG